MRIFACIITMIAGFLYIHADVKIDFENDDSYSSIGVYDVWEDSPFRKGLLEGNWCVTANPDPISTSIMGTVCNDSEKVLGAQRSRLASNRYGVRIDLTEPFELSPVPKYMHVLVHKPKEGRVMLVGLGSRVERTAQNPNTEQFWTLSSTPVGIERWYDAVFEVKGAPGALIRSLVIIPDCESPHNLEEDFLFYIDDIVLNESPMSRIADGYYLIAGDKSSTAMIRKDRYSNGIKIEIDGKTQTHEFNQKTNKKLYQDLTSLAFHARPGQTIIPSIDFTGQNMNAYCYIDYNNDGEFTVSLNDEETPLNYGELVSFNYKDGRDSKGEESNIVKSGKECGIMPSFSLPENLRPGMYRMRFKIDSNDDDPLGNATPGNNISDNGGVIADVMLCVHGDNAIINDFQLNGEVTSVDGSKLNSLVVPADSEFTVISLPEKGFTNGGLTIKCGYNLNAENPIDKYGNPQFTMYAVKPSEFNPDGTYTLSADEVHAEILINGNMVENKPD